ncbi:hypothetical protein V8V55_20675 [Priestia megaterium]|uniref:hypothetical protein n=1 Tax=Priestia megaterium TaxID=1404 RepID=UPI001151CF20
MTYVKTVWKDRIKNSAGETVQEGTPVSAGNLNKIEKGIEDAHKQMEQAAKETVSLSYGLSVLNSPNGSPLDVQIEGRTLVSMGNSDLEGGKKYVLADPKTAVVIDGTTYKGVSKFEGKNARPTIIRTANFEGKISGSTFENPHIAKGNHLSGQTALLAPNSSAWGELLTGLPSIKSLDGLLNTITNTVSGSLSQQLFSFNLIEEVERKVGKIPGTTAADKTTWLKNNLNRLTFNWYGFGSSAGGNRGSLKSFITSSWIGSPFNNASSPTKTTLNLEPQKYSGDKDAIDTNGFVHFLAYAEASDGVTASTINTDYVDLEIELKSNADFYAPRVPLYEVPQESYDKILVEWDVAAVANRYPMIEGVKSLQNSYVMVEGENLLPPFTEATFMNPNARATAAYEAALDATGANQHIQWVLDVIPGQQYTFSYEANGDQQYTAIYGWNGSQGAAISIVPKTNPKTFTVPSNYKQIVVFMTSAGAGSITYKNPMLTLGSVAKPFKPRNPSYLYVETVLRGLNSVNDFLYQDDGRWKLLKKWEDITLDGSYNWNYLASSNNLKVLRLGIEDAIYGRESMLITKFNGRALGYENAIIAPDRAVIYTNTKRLEISVSNQDSGWSDVYVPNTPEIKAFFNGWKSKTLDSNNKPISWVSIIDGTDAPTQTLEYVSTNRAAGYTGYRLLYQIATSKVVDITDKVEGSLSISGQTQVSIDSGVVVREKAIPKADDLGRYRINSRYLQDSTLTNKVSKILSIMQNNVDDTKNWSFQNNSDGGNANGALWAQISADKFNPNANYYVTYLVLEKEKFATNPVNVKASYNTSIRSTVDQMNEQLADVKSLASIHDRYLYKLLLAAKANGWSV